jgi:hypothetical protein
VRQGAWSISSVACRFRLTLVSIGVHIGVHWSTNRCKPLLKRRGTSEKTPFYFDLTGSRSPVPPLWYSVPSVREGNARR